MKTCSHPITLTVKIKSASQFQWERREWDRKGTNACEGAKGAGLCGRSWWRETLTWYSTLKGGSSSPEKQHILKPVCGSKAAHLHVLDQTIVKAILTNLDSVCQNSQHRRILGVEKFEWHSVKSQELEVWFSGRAEVYHNLLSLFLNSKNKFKSSEQ